MSEQAFGGAGWFTVEISSGDKIRVGAALTERDWGIVIDNEGNEYSLEVIGRKDGGTDDIIVVDRKERLKVLVEAMSSFSTMIMRQISKPSTSAFSSSNSGIRGDIANVW